MRILDLLRMSSANLWKRKVRTLLTILGVVIGTASIVVMVSLGLGSVSYTHLPQCIYGSGESALADGYADQPVPKYPCI